MSRRVVWSRVLFSNLPMLAWNLMLKRLASISLTLAAIASAARSRSSLDFALAIFIHLANLDPDRELLRRDLKGFHGELALDSAHFENHPAGEHDGHPAFHVALTRTHARFRGLLGEGLVRKHPEPNASAALDLAGHGHAGGLQLAVGDPGRLEGLDAEFAEGKRRAARGYALHLAALHFTELQSLGAKHVRLPTFPNLQRECLPS